MLVHGLWGFSLLSARIGPDVSTYLPSFLVLLLQVVPIVVLMLRRKKIAFSPTYPATHSLASPL